MDILKQCQIWHENNEYQRIIDAMEAIPAEERTPEQDSELARAYNNLAEPDQSDGLDMLQRAIDLLKPHAEYFQGDHLWNFRMGYSYYYLGQEGVALRYFNQAMEARPGDEDTQRFIDWCWNGLALPGFQENFRERTAKAWAAFAEQEAELRRFMDEDKKRERGDELIAKCSEILKLAFADVCFEMGFNGEKHELILTPEGDKVKLFELVYFRRHAPAEVLEHWSILVGRKPSGGVALRFEDWQISGEDVQVWLEQHDNLIDINMYCAKLVPALEQEEGKVWWMLTTLADQVLGEIASMRHIDRYEVLDKPQAEPAILLDQLPETLAEMGLELSNDPEAYLEQYTGYKLEPNKDPEADWRLDVVVGSTTCIPLINGYSSNKDDVMNMLHADGAVAGFLCYPLDGFTGEDATDQIFAFRDALEEALLEYAGVENFTLIGGATGLYCGYVDFIAWDLYAVLDVAKAFFADSDAVAWADFHVFRRATSTVRLWERALPEPPNYIPYSPENAEAFYQQLEQWNDDDEYSWCIKALEDIPVELRDYRFGYALARALENWAIIGDHDQGTSRAQGDKALHRAIRVLEEVREAGQGRAEWNMRMAYAYQYLEQEELAISYAKIWRELDPADEKAPMVIQECQEELAQRQALEAQIEVKGKTACKG